MTGQSGQVQATLRAFHQGLLAVAPHEDAFGDAFEGLDAVTAARFRKIAGGVLGGGTYADLLARLSPADVERFAEWLLAESGLSAPPSAGAALPDGCTRADVERWAETVGLSDVLRQPASRLIHWAPDAPLIDVFPKRSPKAYDTVAMRAVARLNELAARVSARRASEAAMIAGLPEAVDPPLDGLYAQAIEAYRRLLHPLKVHFHDRAVFYETPPSLQVDYPGGVWRFDIDAPRLQLPVDPQAALAVVAPLLEVFGNADLRAKWARVVATPLWRRDIDAIRASQRRPDAVDPERPIVAWEVDTQAGVGLHVLTATLTAAGKYKGRRVPASEVQGHPALDAVERGVVALLMDWNTPPTEVVLDALERLAGHGRVVRAGGAVREAVALRRASLQLRFDVDGAELVLGLQLGERSVSWDAAAAAVRDRYAGGRMLVDDTTDLTLVRCTHEQLALLRQLVARRQRYPIESLGDWLEFLPSIQAVVPVSLHPRLRGERLDADHRPLLRVRMEGRSVVIDARMQLLPDAPDQTPGEGPETLHVLRDGRTGYAQRDLAAEPLAVADVLRDLGVPESCRQGTALWAVDDPEVALDVVRNIDPLRHRVELDAMLPRVRTAGATDLSLEVRPSGIAWFAVSGKVRTKDGDIQLTDLLAAVRDGRRYVPVGKSGFVLLEANLIAHAKALDVRLEGGTPTIGAVHAPLVDALVEAGATVDGAAEWREAAERLVAARTATFDVPAGLRAELRPYQRDGFVWLARQAMWTSGAVLADDMGLGKTVQATALLLHRAELGPALVVAPTSVVFNWAEELARFAPSLRVVVHHGGARRALDVGAGVVVLTSYGVLLRESKALAAVPFATLVVDEAQALKNPDAQRTKAARSLNASFKLALSGTPIENHEVELWSLFGVLVPGLFGSLSSFASRFGQADPAARAALAAMVAPFMLRRTKRLVAPDLPERQEITQLLELSEPHVALYEEGVRRAQARIDAAAGPSARFVVGQELMRLRQLACDPRLPDPSCPFEGPKIRWLVRGVEAVVEAGEQALVFSSYTTLLELARAALSHLRVAWLTGATSASARRSEVERFQAGDADVFLISLKAGGTGLNLTAASYVFILDPWFNPAAEDQAADRAHRIGQPKKVTIYRGVARGTVEEKIRLLQAKKRELVDQLLEGSGSDEVLSPADLVWLLSGAGPAPDASTSAPAPTALLAPVAPAGDAQAPPPRRSLGVLADPRAALEELGLAPSTVNVYTSGLTRFIEWCEARQLDPHKGGLAVYLDAIAGGELPVSRRGPLLAALGKLNVKLD